MQGVIINDLSTNDYYLYYTDIQITHPEAQTSYVQVPGRNGAVDLTEVNGSVCFNNGTLTMTFVHRDNIYGWHELVNAFVNKIHGQKCKIILRSELDYYYIGRCSVATVKDNQVISSMTITADCEPFKYAVQRRDEDWLWDPFNFETGVITTSDYSNIAVSGTKTLNITHYGMPVTPVFVCSADMTVDCDGQDYNLKSGRNQIFDIIIDKDTTLTFKGTGTVTVEYRGGLLM